MRTVLILSNRGRSSSSCPPRWRCWRLSPRSRHKTAVVTNQSGVGRGLVTEAALGANARANGRSSLLCAGRIDAIYYCPHATDGGCGCRKPTRGLSLEAARDSGIDLSLSSTIGDTYRDVQAANHSGVKGILVDRILPEPTAASAPSTGTASSERSARGSWIILNCAWRVVRRRKRLNESR